MWLSNTSTTAMVMPIAEAVLQQLICTGLADSHGDSETADATEGESGTSASREAVRGLEGGPTCFSLRFPFVKSVVSHRRFRQGGEPREETAGASLPQREVRVRSRSAERPPPPSPPPQPQTVYLANAKGERTPSFYTLGFHLEAFFCQADRCNSVP